MSAGPPRLATDAAGLGAGPASSGQARALGSPGAPEPAAAATPRRGWAAAWPWIARTLTAALLLGAAGLLWRQLRGLDTAEVWRTLQGQDGATLALAAALAAASHAVVASYDLVGRHLSGHRLPRARVLATAFVSYAMNLNLGALVGGIGFRLRLYTRQGLRPATVTGIVATSMLSNWSGWVLLAGLLLVFAAPAVPGLPAGAAPWLGGLLLAALAAAWLHVATGERRLALRTLRLRLPGGRLALLQLGLSSLNWTLMAGVIAVLLGAGLDATGGPGPGFTAVLGALLVAAVAGVLTHVPAGLGVLEAVFVALLGGTVPPATLVAALLLYRAFYYLAPLLLAAVVYLVLEARAPEDPSAALPPRG
ncbi:lysylphosphatidylglycerol synthase domain-containing protein [Piscinibacter sakaiensis]|uniref:Inner membrane protein YbhQ n=1 Tax=Piscinibacter sakaiensis TaxID=1547922 RepID=A0A0K8P2M3_PISS1|nr:lysylphosphatidylglycerol synthase domain-containing protein [Piscinibacter sakaiensis]GAP36922.1 hypothetical protein ISF6_2762 [Piscinibacter sakaiensis]